MGTDFKGLGFIQKPQNLGCKMCQGLLKMGPRF